jgi:signal transduction histidine kinase
MPDSFDLIAKSIERALLVDVPPPTSPQQLAGSIDRIMLEEARGGSLRLAEFRVLVVSPFVVLGVVGLLLRDPGATPALRVATTLMAAVGVLWLAIAIGLAQALRRGWYRRWVPHAMPAIDATMIAAGFVLPLWLDVRGGREASAGSFAIVAVLCAFLSISGGLRLSRSSSRIGMALGVGVFLLAAAIARVAVLPALAIAAALAATGLLSASVSVLVRRLVADEVAKSTLSRMYREASVQVEAREQVLKFVSHDLRNPLGTVVMGASLLLEERLTEQRQRDTLERMKRAGELMRRLVGDLLDVAKLEAGRLAIAPREVAVPPLIEETTRMLDAHARLEELALETDVPDGLPTITADRERVIQVLANLVGNAIKFTPKGGRIVVAARPAAGGVQFSVRDTGPGIPPEQLDRLFSEFWQANPADRRGIGLGLTIAKSIVDAHGGRIWVESRLGEGTTFHFVLGSPDRVPSIGLADRRATVSK